MCEPIHELELPPGVAESCDAVASFYLHDPENAGQKLFKSPDPEFFQVRQRVIEHLKDGLLSGTVNKTSLDMWLWGKCFVTEIWTDRSLSLLVPGLKDALSRAGPWSLQVLPASIYQTGHHMAFGRSKNGKNWWLLDPSSALTIFESSDNLANYLFKLLTKSQFGVNSRTVLLEITRHSD